MSEYPVTIEWQRGEQIFTDNRYSRGHTWRFDSSITIPASSSPHIVPLPYSVEQAVDPEEAFVASLSSCHMLWFLSIAARQGFCVDSYTDAAVGVLDKDTTGRLAMTRVTLRPRVVFSGSRLPELEDIQQLHHLAHQACFLANSVKTQVICQPMI